MIDSRTTIEDVATRALDKWRIYHTQAKVNDLSKALLEIKRFDILKVITQVPRLRNHRNLL